MGEAKITTTTTKNLRWFTNPPAATISHSSATTRLCQNTHTHTHTTPLKELTRASNKINPVIFWFVFLCRRNSSPSQESSNHLTSYEQAFSLEQAISEREKKERGVWVMQPCSLLVGQNSLISNPSQLPRKVEVGAGPKISFKK